MSDSIEDITRPGDKSSAKDRSEFAMGEGASGGLKSQDLTDAVIEDPSGDQLRRSGDVCYSFFPILKYL